MILGGNISLAMIALGTVLKIFHWPGAGPTLLLGFFILCFVFFPSALYLNYTATKKNIGTNLSAFLGGTILMVGILFKIMHWPGAAMLLVVGWTILLGIFIPLLLFSKLKENISGKEKRVYTLGAVSLIIFELATMFKIMHWPGAGPLLILGSFSLVALFIPLYTNMKIKANLMSPGQFVFVITLSMYAVVLTSLLAMNVSGPVLERFSRDEADNSHIVNYFEKKKERLLSEMSADSTQAIQLENKKSIIESASKVKDLIHNIRVELVSFVEGFDKATAQNLLSHPNLIIKKDNYDMVNAFLIAGQGNYSATLLKTTIEKYRSDALKAAGSNEKLASKINGLLNTNSRGEGETQQSWEEANFRNNMLISTLARLSAIEKNICLIETEVLTLKN